MAIVIFTVNLSDLTQSYVITPQHHYAYWYENTAGCDLKQLKQKVRNVHIFHNRRMYTVSIKSNPC